MKKILFFVMALVAMVVTSCNCKTSKCETLADEDSVEVVNDTVVLDTAVVVTDTLAVE